MLEIIKRSEAKAAKLTRYFTGKACCHGHIAERAVRNGECAACAIERLNTWRKKNPNVQAAHRKKHSILHRERELLTAKNWKLSHPEMAEALRVKKNLATVRWAKNNPHKRSANEAARRAAKHTTRLPWLTMGHIFEMECIYRYCSALRFIGLEYHVDHIIPLRGKMVNGLHAPWNLQVIPALENLKKGNKVHHA